MTHAWLLLFAIQCNGAHEFGPAVFGSEFFMASRNALRLFPEGLMHSNNTGGASSNMGIFEGSLAKTLTYKRRRENALCGARSLCAAASR